MPPLHFPPRLQRATGTLLCLAALCAAPPAAAQIAAAAASAPAARPDPLDPRAQVPALRYSTALAGYRRLDTPEPRAWREANDVVTRIGGWRTYTREAHAPEPAASSSASPTPSASTPAAKPAPAASAPARAASAPAQPPRDDYHHHRPKGAPHGHH